MIVIANCNSINYNCNYTTHSLEVYFLVRRHTNNDAISYNVVIQHKNKRQIVTRRHMHAAKYSIIRGTLTLIYCIKMTTVLYTYIILTMHSSVRRTCELFIL